MVGFYSKQPDFEAAYAAFRGRRFRILHTTMNDIHELRRLTSPAPKPQSLAWDGTTLWMGSRQTHQIYAIDPKVWTVRWQVAAPGTPYGMTAFGGELRVLCGETADDHRIIRRCLPYHGFDAKFALPCPDDTGS